MTALRRARLSVSVGALEHNFRLVRRAAGAARLLCAVKADAYGHGMTLCARLYERLGADGLCVATIDEAVRLREAGVQIPVLVLGGTPENAADEAVARDISLAVYDEELLLALNRAAARQGKPARAHLKIDTGMNRVGAKVERDLPALLAAWRDAKNVSMEAAFTHFCDSGDEMFTASQDALFCRALDMARAAGFTPWAHAAASAPLCEGRYLHDGARAGVVLYGAEVNRLLPGITPAQRLTAYPTRIAEIEAGETVGYGRTFTALRPTRVMTVPVGYGDGYKRALSNKASALVCGLRAPLIGRVCMDQTMFDVTDIPNAGRESEVTLLGAQGADRITPDEMAAWADTIPYEIMLSFPQRLTREVID